MNDDILIAYGQELKSLGDGRIGGYGITFGGKDLEGDFFTPSTYFGAHGGDGADCLFHHSLPVKGIDKAFSEHLFAPVKVTRDDIGLFCEIVLDMSHEYESAVHGLVEQKKLGLSSGAASHMVRRLASGELKRWPISEFSLTPQPAEPRNKVQTLKSLFLLEQETKASQITTERDFEEFLREAGFPKAAATTITSYGYKALRRRDAEMEAVMASRLTYARTLESNLTTGVL